MKWRLNGFCYLGYRLNPSGGCEAIITARARIGWVRFKECGEMLPKIGFL